MSSIFLLTACILSYGFTGAFAAEGSQEVPLSVNTDYPNYADGNTINISGKVRDSSMLKAETPVIIRIKIKLCYSNNISIRIYNSKNYWGFSFKH